MPDTSSSERGLHLRKHLEQFAPSSEREEQHRAQMLELLDRGEAAFDRLNTSPGHFTASAFVLDPGAAELLLIHHKKLKRWLQPGGHIEPSDSDVFAAARREVEEETGISRLLLQQDGLFDLDIHEIPALPNMAAHWHYDVRVLFRAESTEVYANDEVLAVRWFPVPTLSQWVSDASVLVAAEKLVAAKRP